MFLPNITMSAFTTIPYYRGEGVFLSWGVLRVTLWWPNLLEMVHLGLVMVSRWSLGTIMQPSIFVTTTITIIIQLVTFSQLNPTFANAKHYTNYDI